MTDFDQDGLGFGRDPDGSRMSQGFGARWTDEPIRSGNKYREMYRKKVLRNKFKL